MEVEGIHVKRNQRIGLWFVAGWLLLNLLQAVFTELFHDEAYYWYLSKRPQLGYSEHAPGMMILLWLSSWIPGEIGVRIFPVLMNTVAVWLMFRLTKPKDVNTFFIVLFGMAGMHVAAFFAAPDSPLFFFAMLFWWAYDRFLSKESLQNSILLGVIISLMLYSKYHGAMIVFFTVLSNRSLWTKKGFWIAATTALFLYVPHLYWLWEDGFGTFLFHLGDRNPGSWYPGRTLEFILAFILLAGPFASLVFLWIVPGVSPANSFEKALKWTFIGVLGFLTVLTFKSRVEGNWAASALVPLFILGYQELEKRPIWLMRLKQLSLVSICLIGVLRVYLVVDFLPGEYRFRNEFHGWDTWAMDLKELADDTPVVFFNWYQYPSKYAFYSGEEALGFSNAYYHPTQISKWTDEAALQGQKVRIVATNHFQFADTLLSPIEDFYTTTVNSFRSFGNILIECEDLVWNPSDSSSHYEVFLTQMADTAIDIRLEENARITGILREGSKQVLTIVQEPTLSIHLEPGIPQKVILPLRGIDKVADGTYRFALGIAINQWMPTRNSEWLKAEIKR